MSFPASLERRALDGRLLVMLSTNASAEPRFQIADGPDTQQVFGMDVDGLAPGSAATLDGRALGFPVASLDQERLLFRQPMEEDAAARPRRLPRARAGHPRGDELP